MLTQLKRYYNGARIFRFFIHHAYIYPSIFKDLFLKTVTRPARTRPRNIVLKLSARCNAHCRFCYAQSEGGAHGPEMSLDEWKNVIDQSRALGCYTVTLSGGEPLIYPHLLELVRYIRGRRMIPFTTTNGLAASEELLSELDRAGLCALNFSIHGPRDAHDAIVGVPGAFDNIVAMGEYCARKTRIVAVVNHVLTRESAREGWHLELWDMLRPKGFRALNLLPVCAGGPDTSDLLDAHGLEVLDSAALRPDVLMDTKNYAKPLCPAARDDLLVNNHGEVQPCPFIPVTFGNVRNAPVRDLFYNMQAHPMFEEERGYCMPARDAAFIQKYIVPAFEHERLPAPIGDVDGES